MSEGENRVDTPLPCSVVFPGIWSGSQPGLTASLHRKGMLVACRVREGRKLPLPGACASVHIELPPNRNFPPKYIRCDTTLVGVEQTGEREFQFAMRILSVDFADVSAHSIRLMELDSDSCGYVM